MSANAISQASKGMLISVGVVTAFMLLGASVFGLHYLTPDDPAFSLISAGCGFAANSDAHLPYSHIWTGTLLKALYDLASHVPWYSLCALIVELLAFSILCFVLWLRLAWLGVAVFIVIFAGLCVQMECALNFTFIACLPSLAGFFLLLQGLESLEERTTDAPAPDQTRRRNSYALACGTALLLMVIGSLIRYASMALTLTLAVPYIVLRFWGKNRRRKALIGICSLLGAFALSSGLDWINETAYKRSPGWQDTCNVIKMVQQFVDYDRGSYTSRTAPTCQAIGWAPVDVMMAKTYFVRDPDVYSVHNMRAVLSHSPPYRADLSYGLIRARLSSTLDWRTAPGLLMLLMMLPFIIRKRSECLKLIVYSLYGFAFLLVLAAAFKLPRQVYLPVLTFALVLSAFHLRSARLQGSFQQFVAGKAVGKLAFLLGALLISLAIGCEAKYMLKERKMAKAANQRLRQTLSALDPGPAYLMWDPMPYAAIQPLDDVHDLFNRFKLLAPHICRTPLFTARESELHVKDVFEGINSGKILMTSNATLNTVYAAYVRRHYGKEIIFHPIDLGSQPAFQLYRCSLADDRTPSPARAASGSSTPLKRTANRLLPTM